MPPRCFPTTRWTPPKLTTSLRPLSPLFITLHSYKFFFHDCTASDHGWSFCLGIVTNGFRDVKVLTRTTHPKLLTAPKALKKKKKKQKDEWNKKQKDEWNKSLDVSDDEDPALKPRSIGSTTRSAFKQPSPRP
uniref:Uncharacterized protein n=1 Tax=Romanomermis culicivorax TaxID=13658 RepID=A0A915IJM3_ROMCU